MRLWRYCLAGLLYDAVAFIAWIVIPIRAERMGATPTQLGLLVTASSVVYTLNSLAVGRLADRMSKSALAFIGCLIGTVACAFIGQAGTLGLLFLAAPLFSLGGSIFWPTIQGSIGSEADPARMEKAIGLFNVMWSLGKTLGFVVGGWLTYRIGTADTMWIAAAAMLPLLFAYPWRHGTAFPPKPHAAAPDRAVFRTLGYVANFVAFGVGTVFQNQFYKYLNATGLGTLVERNTFFGLFLGTIFGAQTVMFVLLQRGTRWTYRRGWLYLSQALLAAATLAIPLAGRDALVLALAPLVGIATGFSYASSIYYSLHGPGEHGKYSGFHEAALGAGTFIVPLVGGALADAMGDLRWPYWVAAGMTLAAVGLEEAIYRTRSRS